MSANPAFYIPIRSQKRRPSKMKVEDLVYFILIISSIAFATLGLLAVLQVEGYTHLTWYRWEIAAGAIFTVSLLFLGTLYLQKKPASLMIASDSLTRQSDSSPFPQTMSPLETKDPNPEPPTIPSSQSATIAPPVVAPPIDLKKLIQWFKDLCTAQGLIDFMKHEIDKGFLAYKTRTGVSHFQSFIRKQLPSESDLSSYQDLQYRPTKEAVVFVLKKFNLLK